MLDRENQRLEDERQKQNVLLNGDSRIGVEAEAEEVGNCNGEPLEDHNVSCSTPSSGRSAEEEVSVICPLEIIGSVETNAAEELMEAINSFAGVPTKAETSTPEGPSSVPETCTTIDSRSVSAIAVIALFLFVILYPRFGGQNPFVDFACFTLLVLFYFYRVEAFGRN